MEILGQLSVEERNSYRSLVGVLERRYGTLYQTEVYRARFWSRVQARGEPLQHLAHDWTVMRVIMVMVESCHRRKVPRNKLSPPEWNYCVTQLHKALLAVVKSLDFYHPYLYGSYFIIRTDYAALKWLKTLKNLEGQLARWLGNIDRDNYEVQHRLGVADSLSRPCEPECKPCRKEEHSKKCILTSVTQLVSAEKDLVKMQFEDADLQPVLEWLQQSTERLSKQEVFMLSPTFKNYWSQWDLFRLNNGLFERQWETPDGLVKYWQLVVPKKLRSKILNESHNQITSGHLEVKKTLGRLRQIFYWMGMHQDVEEWCRACDVCCAKKSGYAPLQLYQVGAPMEIVTVDFVGLLPPTDKGNRYICVAMNYFTKWPDAYAIPDQKAVSYWGSRRPERPH
ncbi:hypothetical protein Pmani_007023 [Petrolisthes manimaculis]|uniref:RNA-directed DNA polymerase n=1 Tax=Petrolisthes manimaculis TaxID=1843537 RepID=A0AAE1Q9U1_9EUCA|nr:hypothetical protein Pmani_007023 [Petrolisthes manimaculis]